MGAGISTIVLSQRDAFPSFFDQKRKVFFSSPRFPHHDHYFFPNGAGLREEAREKKRDRTDKKIPGTSPLQLSAHGGLLFPIFWLSGNIFLFQNFYYIYISSLLGLMKHRQESKLPGEISITSDMEMTPPLWQKVKN